VTACSDQAPARPAADPSRPSGTGTPCRAASAPCRTAAPQTGAHAALGGADEIFGEPLRPDEAEHQDIRVLRDQLAAPGEPRTQHLGEAETLAIIIRRHLSCFFATDDRSAARMAAQHGIQAASTWHLLKVAHRKAGSTPILSGDMCRPFRGTVGEYLPA